MDKRDYTVNQKGVTYCFSATSGLKSCEAEYVGDGTTERSINDMIPDLPDWVRGGRDCNWLIWEKQDG